MPKVDLKLYSKDSETATNITTTVGYINPNAANSTIKQFAQQLNNLTNNIYDESDKVTTVNLDTAEDDNKFRDISITGTTKGETATITFNCTTNESTAPAVFAYKSGGALSTITPTAATKDAPTVAKYTCAVPNDATAIYIGITEKSGFYSEFVLVQPS